MPCPYCNKEPSADRSTPEGRRVFPFCSERCKLADLGAWAAGSYAIPAVEVEDELISEVPEDEGDNSDD